MNKWILVLSTVVVSGCFASGSLASELLDRMLSISDECGCCNVYYGPVGCDTCTAYECGVGWPAQIGGDSGFDTGYPLRQTLVDAGASAKKTDQLIEELHAMQGTLDKFREKTDGQLQGLQHDVENQAKQVKSLAETTDGQLRGLQHDAEATRTQITNQSTSDLAKLDALAAQLKQFAEKTDGQLRGLIHDAEATHKQLEFLTKTIDANAKEMAAIDKRLDAFAHKTDGQIRGLKHDLEAIQEQLSNASSRRRKSEK